MDATQSSAGVKRKKEPEMTKIVMTADEHSRYATAQAVAGVIQGMTRYVRLFRAGRDLWAARPRMGETVAVDCRIVVVAELAA